VYPVSWKIVWVRWIIREPLYHREAAEDGWRHMLEWFENGAGVNSATWPANVQNKIK
jgi:hypothetical protein